MPTYLFGWNPRSFGWEDMGQAISNLHRRGSVDDSWSCGNTKDLPSGSRFFLIRLGREPKGIVGSGVTRSNPAYGHHWDPEKSRKGKKALYVDIRFDALAAEPLITWSELQKPPLSATHWGIQASGVRLTDHVADALEKVWSQRTGHEAPFSADEIDPNNTYPEGTKKTIVVNGYERSPSARAACVAHHGTQCKVCETVLQEVYGKIATGFIHVHHIVPVSKLGKGYQVNPIKDLVPVCPTCHAVMHLRTPPLSITEARQLLADTQRKRRLTPGSRRRRR